MSQPGIGSLPKRFYAVADAAPEAGGFVVRLDGRPLRTPGRRALLVPFEPTARAIAAEWAAQETHIDPATMPVTRLANTVLDGIAGDVGPMREDLKRYVETDLLFYRAEAPERLAARQAEQWDPVLRAAEASLGAPFAVTAGIVHVPQPRETLETVARRLDAMDEPFALAALHQMTTLTGSILLGFAVLEGHLPVAEAWRLAHLDEDWNIEQWGEDAEASARRQARFAEMRAAALVLGRCEGP